MLRAPGVRTCGVMGSHPVGHGPGAGPDRLEIRRVERADGSELRLFGDLTLATVTSLIDELVQVERSGPALLVLDVRRLRFIDSSGLTELLAARTRGRRGGRRLVVVMGPGPVERLLAVTGLQSQFETAPTPPNAVAT